VRPWNDPKVRLFGAAILIVFLTITLLHVNGLLPSADDVKELVDGNRLVAFAAYIPAAAALRLIMFPASILSVAAGLLFGALAGTVAAVAGATIAACGALLISRYVGGDRIKRRLPRKARDFDVFLERKGYLAVLYVRLLPAPHTLIDYAAGFTCLRLRHMFLGTLIGAVPMALAYNILGDRLSDLGHWSVKAAAGGLIALSVLGWWLGRRSVLEEREARHEAGTGDST